MFRFRKNFRNNGSIIKLISSKRTHMNGLSFNLRFPFLIPFHIPFHSVPWKCDFIIFHSGEKLNSLYIYIYILFRLDERNCMICYNWWNYIYCFLYIQYLLNMKKIDMLSLRKKISITFFSFKNISLNMRKLTVLTNIICI